MNYYVLELETEDGVRSIGFYFDANGIQIRSDGVMNSIRLNHSNVIAITYILSRYVERVLSEDEIRDLLE